MPQVRCHISSVLHVDAGGGRQPARAARVSAGTARGPRAPAPLCLPPDGGQGGPRRRVRRG